MRIKNSFWNFLAPEPLESPEDALEKIRNAMLSVVRSYCRAADFHLEFKISYARDVGELWYLRSDLMQALCDHQDETRAHALMVGVTTLFVGHHPAAANSKFKQQQR
ncbi:MAG: hypothetical protein A3E00_05545 [Curvibacter sp. RIFCSPHIGHO2_12_FULL_63_18]|uniref:hypothetical protein n=1 Tax=Rhodoferax sp. TaxID=50421 RepID=UPI0008CDC3C1|nr:hypothetical protein [Rhodoferax sp.]OGO96044.1 MAG: hypothetical protein A2037_13315 [Curvibacter sp. GWA2_63_95]OGP04734.1 MAG: hypothetical protein A3E00_05545 [Curvibacter sp. RIFCSPHIGHO2_12_FULL_63_18]HCX81810.1 hypothetical protein [Rhodoferax sp.]